MFEIKIKRAVITGRSMGIGLDLMHGSIQDGAGPSIRTDADRVQPKSARPSGDRPVARIARTCEITHAAQV